MNEKCYNCGETEPEEYWTLDVMYGATMAKARGRNSDLVISMISCKDCVLHYLATWGQNIASKDWCKTKPALSYDHDEHIAKIKQHNIRRKKEFEERKAKAD